MNTHVILMAMVINADTRDEAAAFAADSMPLGTFGAITAESWWQAEDDRIDGGDCMSAIFVNPGGAAKAARILMDAGLSGPEGYDTLLASRGVADDEWDGSPI